MPAAMHEPQFLRFASDATIVAFVAGGMLSLSALAMWRDHRRKKRHQIDAVGLLPWRDIAAVTCFAGLILLGMAVMGWIRG